MKIKEYVKGYTSGKRVTLMEVIQEEIELLTEILKFNKVGIKEETGDVFHFLQLWFYWRFGINGEIWKFSEASVQKFIDRKKVWNQIYICAGLKENISGFVGNYNKEWKVVKHLAEFGITPQKAKECYTKIVLNK